MRLQSLNNCDNFNSSKNFSIECTLYEKFWNAIVIWFFVTSYTSRVFLTSYSTLSNFPFHQTLSKTIKRFKKNVAIVAYSNNFCAHGTWQCARAIAVATDTNEHGPNLYAAKSTRRARSRNNSLPRGSIGRVCNRYLEAFLPCPAIHS